MADEPASPAVELTSQQLLCQLFEEVGYLRGVIQSIDANSDDDQLNEILVAALRHHDRMSAIRRTYRLTAKPDFCNVPDAYGQPLMSDEVGQ